MSLQSQLTRMAHNVGTLNADTNAIFEALRAKGVDVPANARLSDVADMIETIELNQTYVTIGGRQYKTVTIGNQEWLAENLDYKFDVNGSQIPIGVNGDPTTSAAWYYNNDEATYGVNGNKYGLLYNWYAVKYLEDNKATMLPNGWHVPTLSEFSNLITIVDDSSIKVKSTTGWSTVNGDGSTGFSAYPAGTRVNSNFYELGTDAYFWSSTMYNSTSSYYFHVGSTLYTRNYNYVGGYSLRLVKDLT